MTGHHLVLGELTDFLTGTILPDTHDERYRQKIARLLVLEKGYRRMNIIPRHALHIAAGGRQALVRVDFVIRLQHRPLMLIKYGPGSLVSRYQPALAAARLLAPHPLPLVVVTNGETASILDGVCGRVLASGLDGIPDRKTLAARCVNLTFTPLDDRRVEQAARILYAFEVDGRCPCDDDGGCVSVTQAL